MFHKLKLWFSGKSISLPQKNNDDIFITVVGFSRYYGHKPFEIGKILKCEKEPNNPADISAIKVTASPIGTIGYISDNYNTIAGGTLSAGRIYDKVGDTFYIKVCFTTRTKIICKIEDFNKKHL